VRKKTVTDGETESVLARESVRTSERERGRERRRERERKKRGLKETNRFEGFQDLESYVFHYESWF